MLQRKKGKSDESSHSLERRSGFDLYTQSEDHAVDGKRDPMIAGGRFVATINIANKLDMTDSITNKKVKEVRSSLLETIGRFNDITRTAQEINSFDRESGRIEKMEFSADLEVDLNDQFSYNRSIEYLEANTHLEIHNKWDGDDSQLTLDDAMPKILDGVINKR